MVITRTVVATNPEQLLDLVGDMIMVDHCPLKVSDAYVGEGRELVIPVVLPDHDLAFSWEAEENAGKFANGIYVYKCRNAQLIVDSVEEYQMHLPVTGIMLGEITYKDGAVVIENACSQRLVRAKVSNLRITLKVTDQAVDILTIRQNSSGGQSLMYGLDSLQRVASEVGIVLPDIDVT